MSTADRDALTGFPTMKLMRSALAAEVERARRYGRPFTVALLDVDSFAAVNDRLGHAVGDRLLVTVANLLRRSTRASDIVCRVGGDEFAVILPDMSMDGATVGCRRFLQGLLDQSTEFGHAITLCAGLAALAGDDPWSLYRRADEALHNAKREGPGSIVTSVDAFSPGWSPYALTHERNAPTVTGWEYRVEPADLDSRRLDELGAQGWEFVAAAKGRLFFKRPLDDPPDGPSGVGEPRRPLPSGGLSAA